jgi:hypothetical protein
MDNMQPVITTNRFGDKFYRLNEKLHRTDGPAIEWSGPDGNEWWLHGRPLSFGAWLEQNPDMTGEEKVMYKLEHG